MPSHAFNQEPPTIVPSHYLSPRDSDHSRAIPAAATVPTLSQLMNYGPNASPHHTTQKDKTLPSNFSSPNNSIESVENPSAKNPLANTPSDITRTEPTHFHPPIPSHPMITRSKVSIFKKKAFTALSSSTLTEPSNVQEALLSPEWK